MLPPSCYLRATFEPPQRGRALPFPVPGTDGQTERSVRLLPKLLLPKRLPNEDVSLSLFFFGTLVSESLEAVTAIGRTFRPFVETAIAIGDSTCVSARADHPSSHRKRQNPKLLLMPLFRKNFVAAKALRRRRPENEQMSEHEYAKFFFVSRFKKSRCNFSSFCSCMNDSHVSYYHTFEFEDDER